MIIKKIALKNLLDFIYSEQYKSLENKPISPARALSYVNNPNASKQDFVLFMAFIQEELVGFRTVFADVFYDRDTKIKFAWLSGNWTHPNHRRKNISTLLFKEVSKVWNTKLIYSNYATASKLLYDKTHQFTTIKTLNGKRYYQKFCFAEVLPNKHIFFKKTQGILRILDYFLNSFLFFKKQNIKDLSKYKFQKITDWHTLEIQNFLIPFIKEDLFKRDSKIFEWIINYPWIKTDNQTKEISKKYYFSLYAKVFNNTFYSIKKEDEISAIFNISVRDKQIKVSYFYGLEESVAPCVQFILQQCKENNINYLTIYNSKINTELNKYKFLFKKDFIQKFIATKTLTSKHPKMYQKNIHSGDGDSVFT